MLIINQVYPPARGATGRLARDLAEHLAKLGFDIHVLCVDEQSFKEEKEPRGITVTRLTSRANPRKGFGLLWLCLRLFWAVLRHPKVDQIISMTDPPFAVVPISLMAKFKRARHIHWCQDLYPDVLPALNIRTSEFIFRFLSKRMRRALRRCDRVVTLGTCMRDRLITRYLQAEQISVIPNWGDRTLETSMNKEQALSEHQSPDKFRILYAGSIGRAHPMDTILSTAKILDNEGHDDVEFLFVGDGPGFEKLAKDRDRLGIQNIRFLPYQPLDKLTSLYESGDAHLISMSPPAAGCLFPSKLYPALTIGRPILFLGPEGCQIPEILDHYEAGLCIPHGRADVLVEVIKRLRDEAGIWHHLHQGALLAGQDYTAETSLKLWEEVLTQ